MFNLTFKHENGASPFADGAITIGDFSETFEANLGNWSRDDYRASWRRAAARFMHEGFTRFITSAGPPGAIYVSWPCWRRDQSALLINSLILSAETAQFATAEDAEAFGINYPNDGGVSVWECNVRDIAAFEARLHGTSH